MAYEQVDIEPVFQVLGVAFGRDKCLGVVPNHEPALAHVDQNLRHNSSQGNLQTTWVLVCLKLIIDPTLE